MSVLFRQLVMVLTMVPMIAPVVGQPAEDVQSSIELRYQNEAKQSLSLILQTRQIIVSAKAKIKSTPGAVLPYAPSSLTSARINGMSLPKLRNNIENLELTIMIRDELSSKASKDIQEFLMKNLALRQGEGDKITIRQIDLPIPADPSKLNALQRELESARTKAEQVSRERNDIQRELSAVKAQLERAVLDKKASNDSEPTESEEGTEENFFLKDGLLNALGSLAIGIFLFFAALLFGNKLGQAIKGIAGALEALSSALASAPERDDSPSPEATPVADTIGAKHESAQSASIEEAYARVLTIHDDLHEALTPAFEVAIIKHVSNLLQQPNQVPLAVASLEVLDREKANELFSKLSIEDQNTVLSEIESSSSTLPKHELLLEAAESLRSQLLGSELQQSSANQELLAQLVRFSSDELVELTLEVSEHLLPRLYLYLKPFQIAPLLESLAKRNEEKFKAAMDAIAQVPAAQENEPLDTELQEQVSLRIEMQEASVHRPFMQFYKQIITSMDDDLGERLMQSMAEADATLGATLGGLIVNSRTFFRLREEVREEVAAKLVNRDIAALTDGLSDQDKAYFITALSERRREILVEDMDAFEALPDRQKQERKREARKKLVSIINKINGDGDMNDLFSTEQEQSGGEAA